MSDNLSPEEKLLRLIKEEKKPKAIYPAQQEIVLEKKITLPQYSSTRAHLSPPHIIKILISVLLAASCIYFTGSILYPWWGLQQLKLPEVAPEKEEDSKATQEEETKPYEFYLEATRKRQIFGKLSTSEEGAAPITADTVKAKEAIKDINLVGIISGENPVAIIEDKKMQKTYYLNKGQSIGEFQVEDIQEGKVILNYKGQRYELYL